MKVKEVIEMVENRGMHFETIEGRLRIRGKCENMTPKLKALVDAFQPQIYRHYGLDFCELPDQCPMCGGRIEQ